MMKMKLILLATLASLALGAIPLSRQSPDGDDYIPDDRAIGIFTTGNYWGEFTDGNKDLLEAYNLLDKKMVKDDDVKPTSETIEWTQTSKCFWGCSKEYLLVDYYQDGDKSNPVMKVYVATEWGNPPSEFSTSGHEGSLFFGYLNFDDNQAIFFGSTPATGTPTSTGSRPTASPPSSTPVFPRPLRPLALLRLVGLRGPSWGPSCRWPELLSVASWGSPSASSLMTSSGIT